ncbi:flagellar biosynthetic protein FliO [Glaciimonas sp. GS1]|uniref:Flagellar protein n=2 Tax=Glaciimonas soli TaxID=2590999 RepID=A0A843YQ85_9BURK|nr:flagellar biosynthetic protein FliO [Glaciimonas soli]
MKSESTAAIISATGGPPSWGAAGLMQAGSGLVVVIGVIFLIAAIARRLGFQRNGKGDLLKVISSTNVGKQERVVIVEVDDTWLVLGVTTGQINTLHTLPAQAKARVTTQANTNKATSFGAAFAANFAQKLREATYKSVGKNSGIAPSNGVVASSFVIKAD